MFAACETYQIPHLQGMVVNRLGSLLEPTNIVPLFLLARKAENKKLQKMITDYVSNNYEKLKDAKHAVVSTVLKLPEHDAAQVRKLLDSLLDAAEKYKESGKSATGAAPTSIPARTRASQPSSAGTARPTGELIGWSSGNVFSADGPRPGLRPVDGGPPSRAVAAGSRWTGANVSGFS